MASWPSVVLLKEMVSVDNTPTIPLPGVLYAYEIWQFLRRLQAAGAFNCNQNASLHAQALDHIPSSETLMYLSEHKI